MTKGARVIDFDAAGDGEIASRRRVMARAAVPTASRPEAQSRLTRRRPGRCRQPGEQQRHARDVAVVLAGLVGAAEDDVVDAPPVDAGDGAPSAP